MTLRVAQEHDRITEAMNDVLINRIFSAGLTLETAVGLLDSHHRAAGKIRDAIGELHPGDPGLQERRVRPPPA